MGIYVFTARLPVRPALPRRDASTTASTTSASNIIPVDHQHASRVRLSVSSTRTARPTPTGATSARSTPTTKPTWTSITVDPLLNLYDEQLAAPHLSCRTIRRRSSSSPAKGPTPAAARRSTASSAPARSSPAARWRGSIVGPNCRINSYAHVEDSILFEGVERRPARQGPPRDHRQGRAHPAGHRDRLRPRARPRPRLHDQRKRHRRHRQGRRRRALRVM